jgi:serine/threonine-protein kinase
VETAEVSREPQSGAGRSTDQPRLYLPGEVIDDRYRLEREIGRGGMGVVWVAHSLVLGVDVALKLIRGNETGPEGASRMAREANAAARVGHPALVRVFDFGWTPHGDPFLVMEWIRGESLSELLLREQSVPAIRAVQMVLPIADGLRLAHERGIVHRDIKPGNILVSTDAPGRLQPKLLDFGIAKVGPSIDGKLTQVGTVLGSPEYMSPEQALGVEDVDARTDVWSLSIALYELLTGEVPFKRGNYNALMQAIIHERPVPTIRHGVGDASLWAIIEKGLEKSRDDRWRDMNDFGRALASWLYQHGIKEDISGNSVRAVWLHDIEDGGAPEQFLKRALTARSSSSERYDDTISGWRRSVWGSRVGAWVGESRARQFALGAASAGLLGLLIAPALRSSERTTSQGAAFAPAAAAPVVSVVTPAAASQSVGVRPVVTSIESLPPASASESVTSSAGAHRTSGARRPALKPKPKSKRDFGF